MQGVGELGEAMGRGGEEAFLKDDRGGEGYEMVENRVRMREY